MSFIGDAVSSIFGGGSSGGSTGGYQGATNTYIPLNQAQENQDWLTVLSQLQNNNIPQQIYPQIATAAQGIVNNPTAPAAQMAADTSGAAYTAAGNQDIAQGNTLTGTGNAMLPYVQQILQTGFDPQNALYAKTLQQTQDQVNASNAAAGLGTSPVGAAIDANNLSNFNINWQNNLLNRENSAASGASTINQAAGSDITQGANLATTGASNINTGGQIPYTQYNTNLGNALTALNNQSTAGANTNVVPQNVLNALQSYLQLGQNAYASTNAQANQNFSNSLTGGAALGYGAANLIPSMSSLNTLFGAGPSAASYVASAPVDQVASDVAAEGSGGGLLDFLGGLF